jgi:hypothetical protein
MIRFISFCAIFLAIFSTSSFGQTYVQGITPDDPNIDFNDSATVNRHFLGTIGRTPYPFNSPLPTDWWSVVNIRHRNGSLDGHLWGTQIAVGMTYHQDRMFFRGEVGGDWTSWNEVLTTAMPRVLINKAVDDNSTALQVNGDASAVGFVAKQATSQYGSRLYSLHNAQNRTRFAIGFADVENGSQSGSNFAIYSYNDNGAFVGAPFIIERSTGNVGIGTAVALAGVKLAVNGTIQATKLKVKDAANWPDYVFDKNYRLPSLLEVEQYVGEHKHLPGIPSAAEVAEQGQDLGDMNKKLLKKIEELTLYLIDQQKQLAAQQQQHAAQQAEINDLRSRIKAASPGQ